MEDAERHLVGQRCPARKRHPPPCPWGPSPALFLLLFLLLSTVPGHGEEPECPLPCDCPPEPPTCTPGVPTILDGCFCCLTCARQRGESCSARMPCDQRIGLYCDQGAGAQAGLGICMGKGVLLGQMHQEPCNF
ncbi:CCN family member 3-like [Sceloporus undulatus]|uniref:CCN family member 3-like n=1 Tax=Sceloporus undulatus TaxID=8520 RepID=UPI001C4D83B1|nr:CCN family member 3-like [Sceloporus undulatus]